jgi:hypothetical protein
VAAWSSAPDERGGTHPVRLLHVGRPSSFQQELSKHLIEEHGDEGLASEEEGDS